MNNIIELESTLNSIVDNSGVDELHDIQVALDNLITYQSQVSKALNTKGVSEEEKVILRQEMEQLISDRENLAEMMDQYYTYNASKSYLQKIAENTARSILRKISTVRW